MANNETLTSTVGVNTADNRNQTLVGRLLKLKDNIFFGSTELTLVFCNEIPDDEALADMIINGQEKPLKVSIDTHTPGLETLWKNFHYGSLVKIVGVASCTSSNQYWINVDALKLISEDASAEEKTIIRPVLPNRVERRTGLVCKL